MKYLRPVFITAFLILGLFLAQRPAVLAQEAGSLMEPAPPKSGPWLEASAQEAEAPATPESETIPSEPAFISQPVTAPAEAVSGNQAPGPGQKPSQGEGEKAPAQSRPTAVPEFALPEVVITGENELTIGANRLDRKENDVTLGTRDLTRFERTFNDLPGLNKTLTALSTEEAGPSKNTALVLHLGGGVPDTYGGWGLLGQEFKGLQYLLSGYYSNWGGQAAGAGLDGDKRTGGELDVQISPRSSPAFKLTAGYDQADAELPYQKSIRELHEGWNFAGSADWKLTSLFMGQVKITYQDTTLNYWDLLPQTNDTGELESVFKMTADGIGPFLSRLVLDAGVRHASSDFPSPWVTGYDWGWAGFQADFKGGETLDLLAKLQAQGGGGLDLPFNLYPVVDLMWRVFESSKLDLYWKTDRFVDGLRNNFLETEHVSPFGGFPSPTEITGEWGGRLTQKLNERFIFSLSASTAQINGYHDWSDLNSGSPDFIQAYSTLRQVQLHQAGLDLQWNFAKDYQAAAAYEWTEADNTGGDGKNLTNLPTSKGVLSLYRGNEKLETRLELGLASTRYTFETGNATLPAYAALNLDATYHWTKTFSLWLNGDNLTGTDFELQPGYPEPRFHLRGGLEIIF